MEPNNLISILKQNTKENIISFFIGIKMFKVFFLFFIEFTRMSLVSKNYLLKQAT